ncbi:serine/threonine-protein kinase 3 [Pelomyxa schiedti]|nr:serine/threonine-protein kinase 3 [Pelomyxa schiedti]
MTTTTTTTDDFVDSDDDVKTHIILTDVNNTLQQQENNTNNNNNTSTGNGGTGIRTSTSTILGVGGDGVGGGAASVDVFGGYKNSSSSSSGSSQSSGEDSSSDSESNRRTSAALCDTRSGGGDSSAVVEGALRGSKKSHSESRGVIVQSTNRDQARPLSSPLPALEIPANQPGIEGNSQPGGQISASYNIQEGTTPVHGSPPTTQKPGVEGNNRLAQLREMRQQQMQHQMQYQQQLQVLQNSAPGRSTDQLVSPNTKASVLTQTPAGVPGIARFRRHFPPREDAKNIQQTPKVVPPTHTSHALEKTKSDSDSHSESEDCSSTVNINLSQSKIHLHSNKHAKVGNHDGDKYNSDEECFDSSEHRCKTHDHTHPASRTRSLSSKHAKTLTITQVTSFQGQLNPVDRPSSSPVYSNHSKESNFSVPAQPLQLQNPHQHQRHHSAGVLPTTSTSRSGTGSTKLPHSRQNPLLSPPNSPGTSPKLHPLQLPPSSNSRSMPLIPLPINSESHTTPAVKNGASSPPLQSVLASHQRMMILHQKLEAQHQGPSAKPPSPIDSTQDTTHNKNSSPRQVPVSVSSSSASTISSSSTTQGSSMVVPQSIRGTLRTFNNNSTELLMALLERREPTRSGLINSCGPPSSSSSSPQCEQRNGGTNETRSRARSCSLKESTEFTRTRSRSTDSGDDIEVTDPERAFDFIEKLGEGNYGAVWKVCHIPSAQIYAIKKIFASANAHELSQEVEIMKSLDCPWIVKYFGSVMVKNELWIVMEYCAGGSLRVMMEKTKRSLTEREVSIAACHILRGLNYLHSVRKIHRDLKAANVIVNDLGIAKLTDFGVSGQITAEQTKKNTMIGTPYWIAPEIISDTTGYDEHADIWSLGITLIELAHGLPPHYEFGPMRAMFLILSEEPPKLLSKPGGPVWSLQFQRFIKRILVKDPYTRPLTDALLEDDFIRPSHNSDLQDFFLECQESKAKLNAMANETPETTDSFDTYNSTPHANTLRQSDATSSDESENGDYYTPENNNGIPAVSPFSCTSPALPDVTISPNVIAELENSGIPPQQQYYNSPRGTEHRHQPHHTTNHPGDQHMYSPDQQNNYYQIQHSQQQQQQHSPRAWNPSPTNNRTSGSHPAPFSTTPQQQQQQAHPQSTTTTTTTTTSSNVTSHPTCHPTPHQQVQQQQQAFMLKKDVSVLTNKVIELSTKFCLVNEDISKLQKALTSLTGRCSTVEKLMAFGRT